MKEKLIKHFETNRYIPKKLVLLETLFYISLTPWFIQDIYAQHILGTLIPVSFLSILILKSLETNFLYDLGYWLHPKRKDIKREIEAYWAMNPIKDKSDYPSFEELEDWIKEVFPTGRAFRQLAYQSLVKDQGDYDKSFYVWCHIVPWKRLDYSDALAVLRNIKIKPFYNNKKFKKVDVEELFKGYSEKEIKRLFVGHFDGDDYWRALNTYSGDELPVVGNMRDLVWYIDELGAVQFPKPEQELNGKGVKRISHSKELMKYAMEFRNCAKSYVDQLVKGQVYMYIYYGGEKPVMFHVDVKGNILEMKYPFNEVVSTEDKVRVKGLVNESY